MIARLSAALSICGLLACPVLADDSTDFIEALGKAATGAIVAEAFMSACDMRFPDSRQARQDALAGWGHRVGLADYYRFLDASSQKMPDLKADMQSNRERAQSQVDDDVAKGGASCHDLGSALQDNPMFDISSSIRYLLRNAAGFGILVPEAAIGPVSDEVEVFPLVVLSAQLSGKMDEIGSKAGAQKNRDLRSAREDHAKSWLQQWSEVRIFGRITGDDSLREWRDDKQSAFLATCRSFASDDEEAAMARDVGQERIIVGKIRWIRDDREGGALSLDGCRVYGHDPAQIELGKLADDSAGLMLRPLEYEEAFAGPGKGIDMTQVDRVLYDADFATRIDGFGNGYTQRDEEIYVLLRDGTAYHHEWNFAFTDLDLNLSRQREPERWFTWKDSRGAVTLTHTGGLDAGSEIDVSDARRLIAVPQGQMLDQTYYYLNVGMGGSRRDREYVFSKDGQVQYSRNGFVAGNFGTLYIIVAGDSNNNVSNSRYTFDGYTLLIDGPEGQERHFVALIDGQDTGRPEEIIIDGQVYWLRKAEK